MMRAITARVRVCPLIVKDVEEYDTTIQKERKDK
jgi:hypothetical protein